MKRFFAGLLAVCLVGAAFAGCSGSSANYNVNDVASAVETVAKIENPLDITEDDLTYEFGVDMDKVEEFSGQKTGVANTAGTVLVVKASAGSVDDIKAALENYKNGLVSVSENYQNDFPEAYQQVSDGRVCCKRRLRCIGHRGCGRRLHRGRCRDRRGFEISIYRPRKAGTSGVPALLFAAGMSGGAMFPNKE